MGAHGRRLTVKERVLRYKHTHRGMGLYQSIGLTLAALAVVLTMGGWSLASMSRYVAGGDDPAPGLGRTSEDLFEATFVGDIDLARGEDKVAAVGGIDTVFSRTKDLWSTSDLVMGNLECVLLEGGVSYKESVRSAITLGSQADYAQGLKDAGFTALSLANNHAMDYRSRGLGSTMDALHGVDIATVGAGESSPDAAEPVVQDVDGFTVAVFAASEIVPDDAAATMTSPGIATVNNSDLFISLYEMRDTVDLVIVNMHWGEEYTSTESADQQELAHDLIDAGADIVIGEHSHTLQPVELYKGHLIVYGMGDYSHDNAWTRTKDGAAVRIRVAPDRSMTAELEMLRIEGGIPADDPGELYVQRDVATLTKHLDEGSYTRDGSCISIPLGTLDEVPEAGAAGIYEEEGRDDD